MRAPIGIVAACASGLLLRLFRVGPRMGGLLHFSTDTGTSKAGPGLPPPPAPRLPAGPRAQAVVDLVADHASELQPMVSSARAEAVMTQGARMLCLWHVPEPPCLTALRAIVCFAFGQGPPVEGKPTPGPTNKGLAQSVVMLLEEYQKAGAPRPLVMAQWEIADVLAEAHGIQVDVVARLDPNGEYLSTVGVMEHFTPVLVAHDVRQALIVAHPDHAVRCAKVMQRFGVSARGTPFLRPWGSEGAMPWARFGCDAYGYSASSTQPWTRSREAYLMYELKTRAQMVEGGRIDFSTSHFDA